MVSGLTERRTALLFGKRLEMILLRHRNIRICRVHTWLDSLRIYLFPLQFESGGLKNIRIRCRIRQMCVDASRVRKKKNSCVFRISRYGWRDLKLRHATEPV